MCYHVGSGEDKSAAAAKGTIHVAIRRLRPDGRSPPARDPWAWPGRPGASCAVRAAARRRRRRRGAGPLPPDLPHVRRPRGAAAEAARRLRAHLAGRNDDLADLPVDLAGQPELARRVLRALRRVRPGPDGHLRRPGARARRPGAARAVGAILAANPVPVIVPCHRVLAADGSLTGFSGRRRRAPEGAAAAPRGPRLRPRARARHARADARATRCCAAIIPGDRPLPCPGPCARGRPGTPWCAPSSTSSSRWPPDAPSAAASRP